MNKGAGAIVKSTPGVDQPSLPEHHMNKGQLTGIELVDRVAVEEASLVLGAGIACTVAAKERASILAAPTSHTAC